MLLPLLLLTVGAVVSPPVDGFLLLPGPTSCLAPSGRPGDCVLARDCPAAHGPPSRTACGYSRSDLELLYCCERRQAERLRGSAVQPTGGKKPTVPEVNPAPPETNPSQQETNPSQQETNPSQQETNPSQQETNPSQQETNPSHPEMKPSHSETKPSLLQMKPTTRELKPTVPEVAAEPPRTLPTDCGLGYGSRGVVVPNIVNGRKSRRHGWPWAAVIGFAQPSGTVLWQCTGALISTQHVLTAAHCVPDTAVLVVRLGEHDLAAVVDPARQDRGVARRVRHPAFHGSRHDLALLQLDRPVRLGRSVQPICLPDADQPAVGRAGYVTGWGKLSFDAPVDGRPTLQQALVTARDAFDCEALYKATRTFDTRFPGGFGGGVLCAADPIPKLRAGILQAADACQGDSGGPLSIRRPDGRFYLAGLVLEGMGCGSAVYPGLYTRVSSYVDWIRHQVARS